MNLLNLLESTDPREWAEVRDLLKRQTDADSLCATDNARPTNRQTLEAKRREADEEFRRTGSDEAGARLIAATKALNDADVLVRAASNPGALRWDRLQTTENFALLARALDRRAAILRLRNKEARKALADRYHALTMEGVKPSAFWTDAEIHDLAPRAETVERELDFAAMKAEHCRRAEAPRAENFDTLLAHVLTPIP